MSTPNPQCEQMIQRFTADYMEKVFYFCLKKTGKSEEAEDLTQEIALNVIAALNKGTLPESFSAWVWKIARNRYAMWADRKHRITQSLTLDDGGDYEIPDDSETPLDEMIRSEQLALLRRELAFIRRDYRDILVAYYMEEKRVRDIADTLNLSPDTVKQRLHRAREILKEGMNMAREFGIRSYKPEEISFVMSGRNGKKGQPWSIIQHLLYKNIFLETYDNPETAEELSLELGIALPYMEDELEFLVREELLIKTDNKYQPNFSIISREEQRKAHEINLKVQKGLTEKLCTLIDLYMKDDGSKVNTSYVGANEAKLTILVRFYDILEEKAYAEGSGNAEFTKNSEYPLRPNDGQWVITGYETIDWQKPFFVGEHGWHYDDINEVKKDINFGQYKFYCCYHCDKTPEHINWKEAYTLWLVCTGKTDACETEYLNKLLEYGYLKKVDGKVIPNVVIFDLNAPSKADEKAAAEITKLENEICELFKKSSSISRGYVVEQAMNNGWITLDDNTPAAAGAYIYR